MDEFKRFYNDLLGFDPYDFQSKVAELLLNGKNVILSVPTGAGKTWASVMPFLYAKNMQKEDFPQKMIYSLPLRTLTNSIYSDINKLLSKETIKSRYPNLSDIASIQTGEYCDDPYFEKEIVFSTIDQTLSNFLSFPLALSHSLANINAGSVIGSYLIFDEFHLLDPKLSMSTTIGMLSILKNLCRVCIMTATLTDDFMKFLAHELPDFEIVSMQDFPNDVSKIRSLLPPDDKNIKKSIHVCDEVINSDAILEKHKDKTIVICNRVETAQRIFIELQSKKRESTEVICIHSRFFDSDRAQKEELIKNYFGKGSTQKDVILVSTQVIEAGMDISCDVMFTEISPVNSFLQRAGRCARFAKEYGEIFVYDVLSQADKETIANDNSDEADAKGQAQLNNKYLPYSQELCSESFERLKAYDHLDENISKALVNDVLHEDELIKANGMFSNLYNKDIIYKSWIDCDTTHYKDTIRNIQNINVVLLDSHSSMGDKIKPWIYKTISVYKWGLYRWIKNIKSYTDEYDWIIAKVESSHDSVFDDEWQDGSDYFLRELDVSQLSNYYGVVFVNNKYFDYNEAGLLVIENTNNVVSPLMSKSDSEHADISYHKDTYFQHSMALINCFKLEFEPNLNFLFNALDVFWGRKKDWSMLIKMAICFHDYGKLNEKWQEPMLAFQRRKENDNLYFEVLAHTDYNKDTDEILAKECMINKKPAHAGIGAVQSFVALRDIEDEHIARAVSCSILRHHNVDTNRFDTFSITNECLSEVKKLTKEVGFNCEFIQKERGESLSYFVPENGNEKDWLLYFVFVRILRICDQKATESKEKYYKQ